MPPAMCCARLTAALVLCLPVVLAITPQESIVNAFIASVEIEAQASEGVARHSKARIEAARAEKTPSEEASPILCLDFCLGQWQGSGNAHRLFSFKVREQKGNA